MHLKAIGACLIAFSIQAATPALAADPLKIGVLMPTSGVFAVLGQRQLNGMRFAIEEAGGEVAGRKIEMVHEDSEGKPDVGLAKTRKLVLSDRIDVMAGIISSAVALAVAPYLSSQRVPLVISNASTDVLSGEKCDRYVFRVSYSSSQITEPIGRWMAKHAPKNLYVLASDFVAPHEYVAAMKRGYVAGGGTIVGETYTPFARRRFRGVFRRRGAALRQAIRLFRHEGDHSALRPHRPDAACAAQGARRGGGGRHLAVELHRRARHAREPCLP
jgi:branched-chain amino acid transport system substrate-binding protein